MALAPVELDFSGPFSLRAAAGFGFGPTEGRPASFAGAAMRLAFPVDGPAGAGGEAGYAGAVVRQEADDAPVLVELDLGDGEGDAGAGLRQVARVLSLDHDGRGFAAVGDRDPVLGRLQRAHPGQRPVLFHSPYEAAAWSVISARRPSSQAAETRRAISRELGRTFTLAGEELAAFPRPERLVGIEAGPGLPPEKVDRLRGIARAAMAGELDVAALHALGSDRAYEALQRLRGIGPFYAGLIVLRAAGFADAVLSTPEPKGLSHLARYYGLGPDPDPAAVAAVTDGWRPFRTWALVLVRMAGDRGTP